MQLTKTLAIGTELNGKQYTYRIEKVLGQGTFGITYQATVSLSGELGSLSAVTRVAIKEFFIGQYNGRTGNEVTLTDSNLFRNYRHKFIHEATALKKLNHPNIIKVLELFESNNTVYYAMEYCSGGNLDNLIIDNQHLSETKSLHYFTQIADALSCMHENNMLHLDVKPSNIVLRENGDAVLIDFGLSKQFDDKGNPESSTIIGCGTPGYAPLEQSNYHSEAKQLPVTMDVYALGATLYKMLTGTPPPLASEIFENGFPIQILQQKGTSNNTIRCMRKAMSVAKKERYQTINEFVEDIKKQKQTTIAPIDHNDEQKSEALDFYKEALVLYNNKRYKQAFALFMKSAMLGYGEAQFFIGLCYEHNRGTQQSYKDAYYWYKKAAARGHKKAQKRMNILNSKINTTTPQKENKWVGFFKYVATRFIALAGIIFVIAGIGLLFYMLLNAIR